MGWSEQGFEAEGLCTHEVTSEERTGLCLDKPLGAGDASFTPAALAWPGTFSKYTLTGPIFRQVLCKLLPQLRCDFLCFGS